MSDIFNLADTWNNGATVFTTIKVNVTDTASDGGSLLMDLLVAAASKFSVSKDGDVVAAGALAVDTVNAADITADGVTLAAAGYLNFTGRLAVFSPADGVVTLLNTAENDFGRVQFGGTTSAFPSLKRSGTALHSVLANDSGFAPFSAAAITASGVINGAAGSSAAPSLILAGDTTVGWHRNAAGQWTWSASSGNRLSLIDGQVRLDANMVLNWSSAQSTAAGDVGLWRASAGLLEVNSASGGTYRDLKLRNLISTGNGQGSVVNSITAFAGGGQASATAMTADNNRVTTVATTADSVKLPVSIAGMRIAVVNSGANSMQVFGAGTDTINGVATGTGVAHAAGISAMYICVTTGAWFRVMSA